MISSSYTPFLYPSLEVVLCICYLLFYDANTTVDEVSHPYSWLCVENGQLKQCRGSPFFVSLDHYDSKKKQNKEDLIWIDHGLWPDLLT